MKYKFDDPNITLSNNNNFERQIIRDTVEINWEIYYCTQIRTVIDDPDNNYINKSNSIVDTNTK